MVHIVCKVQGSSNTINNQLIEFRSGEHNSVLIHHEMFHFCYLFKISCNLSNLLKYRGYIIRSKQQGKSMQTEMKHLKWVENI
jgi:hypothetical protein